MARPPEEPPAAPGDSHPGQPRALLIDTHSLFVRAFFALPEMTTGAGMPTSALYGLSVLVLTLLREQRPLGVAFALDTGKPTFRPARWPHAGSRRQRRPRSIPGDRRTRGRAVRRGAGAVAEALRSRRRGRALSASPPAAPHVDGAGRGRHRQPSQGPRDRRAHRPGAGGAIRGRSRLAGAPRADRTCARSGGAGRGRSPDTGGGGPGPPAPRRRARGGTAAPAGRPRAPAANEGAVRRARVQEPGRPRGPLAGLTPALTARTGETPEPDRRAIGA